MLLWHPRLPLPESAPQPLGIILFVFQPIGDVAAHDVVRCRIKRIVVSFRTAPDPLEEFEQFRPATGRLAVDPQEAKCGRQWALFALPPPCRVSQV